MQGASHAVGGLKTLSDWALNHPPGDMACLSYSVYFQVGGTEGLTSVPRCIKCSTNFKKERGNPFYDQSNRQYEMCVYTHPYHCRLDLGWNHIGFVHTHNFTNNLRHRRHSLSLNCTDDKCPFLLGAFHFIPWYSITHTLKCTNCAPS